MLATPARQGMVLFEDPQCPYCRQFEELNGASHHGRGGGRRTRRRISHAVLPRRQSRCGPTTRSSSPRRPVASTSSATRSLPHSPPREPGVSRPRSSLRLGARVGLTGPDFVSGVRSARYEKWVLRRETVYQAQDPQGTPAAWLNGHADRIRVCSSTGWPSKASLAARRDPSMREARLLGGEARSERPHRVEMTHQLFLDPREEGTCVLVVLLSLRRREVSRELVQMIEDGSANLVVCRVSRPEIRWRSPGDAGHAPESRRPRSSSSAIRRPAHDLRSAKSRSSSACISLSWRLSGPPA